jgi:hypothetical protein
MFTTTTELDRAAANSARNQRLLRLCVWAGVVYTVSVGVAGAGLARFLPAPGENWNAQKIAEFFRDNEIGIRIGMELILVVYMFYALFSLALARLMTHVEGRGGFLAPIQLLGGVTTAVITMLCSTFWLTASFRSAGRDAEIIQTLNDLGWFFFDVTVMATIVQLVAFGAVCLIDDERPVPLFPRWLGYLSIFFAMTFLSEFFMPSFTTGPLAWHGLLSLYVALGTFLIWIGIVAVHALRAIKTIDSPA